MHRPVLPEPVMPVTTAVGGQIGWSIVMKLIGSFTGSRIDPLAKKEFILVGHVSS